MGFKIHKNGKVTVVAIIFILMVSTFLVFVNAKEKEENDFIFYKNTPTTSTYKNVETGEYTTTFYSDIMFVDEGNRKYPFYDTPIENASSLKGKGFEVVYLDNDSNYQLEILDFNLTSITYNLIVKDIGKTVPIKVWKINKTKQLDKTRIKNSYKDYSDLKRSLSPIQNKEKDIYTSEFGVDKILEIGGNSTTITLQTANSENMENVDYYDTLGPDDYGFQMKWNISSLEGSSVTDAKLILYIDYVTGAPDNDARIWRVDNQTWTESVITPVFSAMVLTNQTDETWSVALTPSASPSINVTKMISTDVLLGNNYSTLRIEDVDKLVSPVDNVVAGQTMWFGEEGVNMAAFASKLHATPSQRPKLNITYTPRINIVTPTPSQLLTDDIMTANFNITAGVNMSICYWTNGTANYSMTNIDNQTFYNNTQNVLLDGSHTISFWCNESSGGAWRQSDTVSFDIDSVNVTTCRDLTVSRTYNLQDDLIATDDCLNLTVNGITIEGNGYVINGSATSSAAGIDAEPYNNHSINNLTITNFTYGIYMEDSTVNATNLVIEKCDDNLYIQNSTLYMWDSNVSDTSGDDSSDGIIYMPGTDNLAYLTNVTYVDDLTEINGNLTRKWYFSTQINDSSGYLESATVEIWDKDNNLIDSPSTDATGQITRQELTEYVNNGGSKTYTSPYTINITKVGYVTNSTTFNLTEVNNVNHIVTLASENSVPTSTLYTPTNNSYNSSPVTFNCSATDAEGLTNITLYIWNDSTTTNTTSVSGMYNATTFTNSLADGEYNWSCLVYDNHTTPVSDWATANYSLTVDSLDPVIDFDTETEANNSNFSRNWIYSNITLTETNFENVSFYLYNATYVVDTISSYFVTTLENNWTGLTDGTYYYNITIYDKAKRSANTSTRKITIDDTPPTINILVPTNLSSSNDGTDFQINYTVSDNLIGLDSCWYTNDSGVTNYSLTCGNNITTTLVDATYNYFIYSNDTLNNLGVSLVQFTISSVNPSINLDYPTNGLWIDSGTDIYFNYTATDDDDLSYCELWGNWSGWHKNFTWSSGLISGTQNYTQVTIPEGNYLYNVWCNDTLDNDGFSPANFTFQIDETFPAVTNESYTPLTVYNDLNVTVFGNITDTNLDTVWLSINHSGSYQNITITDKIGNQYNYTLNNSLISNLENISWSWWANDSAGNENFSSLEYFVVTNRNPYNLTLLSPANNSYINTNYLFLNFLATDDDLDTLNYSIYYSNDSLTFALYNSTNDSTSYNLTGINYTDGATNYFYITANDSFLQNETSNFTFNIDTTPPSLELYFPEASPVYQCSMTNIELNYSASDTNLDYCEYNVTVTESGLTSTANTRVVGCSNTTIDVSFDDSVQTLTLIAVDKAGNINKTTTNIYIDTDNSGCESPGSPGGGGGGTVEDPLIPGFCGDNVCDNGLGNTTDRGETFYNCPEDCAVSFSLGEVNFDTLIFNCFGDSENPCLWETSPGLLFVFVFVGGLLLFTIFFDFAPKKKGIKKFVYIPKFKKSRRR